VISAACKIEFVPDGGDTILLVDVDGWLTDLPRTTASQDTFEADGIGHDAGMIKGLGSPLFEVSFAAVLEPADAAGMCDAFLNVFPAGGTGSLILTGGGEVTTYAPAVLTGRAATLPGPDAVTVIRYTATCGLPTTEDED
jgi:hypothetical protein